MSSRRFLYRFISMPSLALALASAGCGQGPGRKSAAGSGGGGSTPDVPGDTPLATPVDTDPLPPEITADAPSGPYAWKNVVIKGGGFVTGIVFSRAAPNLIYARTDVGGAYRWTQATQRWTALTDWVGRNSSNWTGIESIAADPTDASQVYLAAGTYLTAGNGVILHSTDFGKTFTQNAIAAPMGGNHNGRSMGERLAIDPNLPSTLYFGSRSTGLWTSSDSSGSWRSVASFPARGDDMLGLSFVLFDGKSGAPGAATPSIYVGVATLTGSALYRSRDAGATWQPVPDQPAGKMPHHGTLSSDGSLYLAYNNGPGPNDITDGAIWKLDTESGAWADVSPPKHGFGGVSVDANNPRTLLVSTIDWWAPDDVFRSTNAGASWTQLKIPGAQKDLDGAAWLTFGGGPLNPSGWAGDIEIDPFNPGRALYITGQGTWWSDDVTPADRGESASWVFRNDGLEETVTLDLAVPPTADGPALLSAVGDVGGFRHDDLTVSPASGMYKGPLFGNTTSVDFAENDPNLVVRVGTSTSTIAAGHGAFSLDGGSTWRAFAKDPDASGSGTIAISASQAHSTPLPSLEGITVIWRTSGGVIAYSRDSGSTWTTSVGIAGNARVVADRVNPDKFYALTGGATGAAFVSLDGGATFTAAATGLAGVRGGRLRPVFGIEGDLWLTGSTALYHSTNSAATFTRAANVQAAFAIGFGQAAANASYPALYLSGTVNAVTGLFRSDDGGTTFSRIDDAQHQFGSVGFIAGDQRSYGRVYIGTGGRGLLYGDIAP